MNEATDENDLDFGQVFVQGSKLTRKKRIAVIGAAQTVVYGQQDRMVDGIAKP